MTYRSGVYTAPSDPNGQVGLRFFDDIVDPMLRANGWTFGRDYIYQNDALRVREYSSADGSGRPKYLLVTTGYRTRNYENQLQMAMAGAVDRTQVDNPTYSRLLMGGPFGYSYTPEGYHTATTQASGISQEAYSTVIANLLPTGIEYWVSVTANHIVIATRAGSDERLSIFTHTTPLTTDGAVFNNWYRTSSSYDQYWLGEGEKPTGQASSAGQYATGIVEYRTNNKDFASPSRLLFASYLRDRFNNLLCTLDDMPVLYVPSGVAMGDTVTQAGGKKRVLIRHTSTSAVFYAVDTEA